MSTLCRFLVRCSSSRLLNLLADCAKTTVLRVVLLDYLRERCDVYVPNHAHLVLHD
jgi:hypothetical protein